MQYRNLGRSGLQVSPLCLGCMTFGKPGKGWHDWTLDEPASRLIIKQAIEAGINFFDTANGYAEGTSEEILGAALRDFARRDEMVIATKLFAPWTKGPNTRGLSRKAVFQAIDDSLMRLGTEYVDLYQIHRFDAQTPIEETLEALHDVVKSGKARYIGASSMYAWQFAKALYVSRANGWTSFISMQNHVNLLNREEEREMIPLCIDQGVGVIPWSPLARGRLTRDWDEVYAAMADNDRKIVEAVATLAAARGVSRAQIAMAWLLQKPGISSPIFGASKALHIEDAVAALSLDLSDDEMAMLEAPYVPHPVVGFQ
jgi:aryl-alcohol dehydrogenase-like predicted oxidoreductase